MDGLRSIGIARDYQQLHALLRQRADELEVSRLSLDDAAGLADGHSSKLLAQAPSKHFGLISLGRMLDALGLALVVVEDPAAAARVQQMPKRCARQVRRTSAPAPAVTAP